MEVNEALSMSPPGYGAVAITLACVAAMAVGVRAHRALGVALAALMLTGLVSVPRALSGFSNQSVLAIALLFIVAAGVKRSGALAALLSWTLGKKHSERVVIARLTFPVAAISSMLSNTPTVAMLMPDIKDWAAKHGVAATKLLIPLSFAAIVGGMCTLIGTSTNLLIGGMLTEHGFPPLGIFWIASVGVPAALLALLVLVVLGPHLLPDIQHDDPTEHDPLQFTAEFIVSGVALAGKRLRDVHPRGMKAFAPIQVRRGHSGEVIVAPGPSLRLEMGDRLMFAAPSAELLTMTKLEGLTHALDGPSTGAAAAIAGEALPSQAAAAPQMGAMVEVVVGPSCPLRGRSVGDGSFREVYDAAVVAVVRDGREKPADGLGAWVIELGDVLLLETDASFMEKHRYGDELFPITSHASVAESPTWKSVVTLLGLVALIAFAASGLTTIFLAALALTLVFLLTGIVTWREAAVELNGRIILAIAAALGIGAALEDTGAAQTIAEGLVSLGASSPYLTLILIYVATMIFTEVVTNNAAAVVMLPIALGSAEALGVSPYPFIGVVMIAASASFITPIGYQTNLMVYAAGGYRFGDFARVGIPVTLAVGAATLALAPLVWPF